MSAQPVTRTEHLWWEFRLRDSIRWRALECGLPLPLFISEERLLALAGARVLCPWLDLPGEALPPELREMADRTLTRLPALACAGGTRLNPARPAPGRPRVTAG